MRPIDCLYGRWKQQSGTWKLPGSSWGLSGTVAVAYASSTTGNRDNVIEFEYDPDVSRNTYTETLEALYLQGYGNPQPGLTLSGLDYGNFSVSGSTVSFSDGSTIRMTYRMDTAPVSTKNGVPLKAPGTGKPAVPTAPGAFSPTKISGMERKRPTCRGGEFQK